MEYGGRRQAHLEEIRGRLPEHEERLRWDRARIESQQTTALRELLAFAKERSAWHRARLREVSVENFSLSDLPKLPTMTKQDVMANWNQICTDPRLTLEEVTRALREQPEPAYLFDQYLPFSSGGSSGQRGVYVWDWEVLATCALVTFRYQWRDQAQAPLRVAVIAAQGAGHAAAPLFSVTLAEQVQVRVFDAATAIDTLVNELNHYQPTQIIGYSSIVERLSHEALAGHLRIFPERIATNSEPLTEEGRASTQRAWGVPINNVWGSTEVGICAVACDESPGLYLSEDVTILEVEKEGCFVTPLFNKTFPFIRYALDDAVELMDESCPCGAAYRLVRAIQGRVDQSFIYPNGAKVHPSLFRAILGRDPEILEYQVRQTQAGALIEVVSDEPIDSERLIDDLETALEQAGLEDPILLIKRVPALHRNEATAKLKRFIPL